MLREDVAWFLRIRGDGFFVNREQSNGVMKPSLLNCLLIGRGIHGKMIVLKCCLKVNFCKLFGNQYIVASSLCVACVCVKFMFRKAMVLRRESV